MLNAVALRALSFSAVVLLPLSAVAQTGVAPQKTSSPAAAESLVIERKDTKVTWQANGTGTRVITAVIRVEGAPAVEQMAVQRFGYVSGVETLDIDFVRVRKPDGKVVLTPPEDIQDLPSDVSRLAPIYSDVREKHVIVKALSIGDRLEYSLRYAILKPLAVGQISYEHAFTKRLPVLGEELSLTIPSQLQVNVSSPGLTPSVEEAGDTRTYSWKYSNPEIKRLPKLNDEDQEQTVSLSTFKSWSDVGRWYADLQAPQLELTPAIRSKAAELTSGAPSDEAKIRTIYDFVSTHVHYAAWNSVKQR